MRLALARSLSQCFGRLPGNLPLQLSANAFSSGFSGLDEARGADACVALARDGRSRSAADPVSCLATRRMAERLATPEVKARYARRKWLSEAPNGWIKEAMGFRRFSVPGLAKARGERDLVCLVLDVRWMGRLVAGRWLDSGGIRAGIPA